MRTRLILSLLVAVLMLMATLMCLAQSPSSNPPDNGLPTTGAPQTSSIDEQNDEVQTLREEQADEDQTYFRSRTTFKYEHKFVPGGVSKDIFKSFTLYGFGRSQRWAITAEMPYLVHITTPTESTNGVGDAEFKFGRLIHKTSTFRQGIGAQLNVQTASDPAIGGSATVIKALYANSLVVGTKWILDFSCNYAHSVHLSEGAGTVSRVEPEGNMSRLFPWFAFYLHFDNYYDFPVSTWGNTIKGGLSRTVGKRKVWNVSVFDEYALNDYARAGFRNDMGINITRFFGPE